MTVSRSEAQPWNAIREALPRTNEGRAFNSVFLGRAKEQDILLAKSASKLIKN